MTDIRERLRAQVTTDHVRGCMGRQYSCTCGYDTETEKLLAEAAAEIERLQSCLYAQESVPALYKEIERLRSALAFIADKISDPALVAVADAALEPMP